ncbi:hypothetical protein CDAR_482311 [Caerostris darwini]|uniref:Uncharacterized protein n=1 Tax=Caerostris darwini TaxID=1538125 RepID=A0AAV4TGX2_9ARAC|nr:hypothetical protein CDAR_482311 [Caerostris darwini]
MQYNIEYYFYEKRRGGFLFPAQTVQRKSCEASAKKNPLKTHPGINERRSLAPFLPSQDNNDDKRSELNGIVIALFLISALLRLASHFGDLEFICDDLALTPVFIPPLKTWPSLKCCSANR